MMTPISDKTRVKNLLNEIFSTLKNAPTSNVKKDDVDVNIVDVATEVYDKLAFESRFAKNHNTQNCKDNIAVSQMVNGGSTISGGSSSSSIGVSSP